MKNITIEEFCSVPCDDKVTPKLICELCKSPLIEDKNSTIGEVCGFDPCYNIGDPWCEFCASIRDLETTAPLSSSSEIPLAGPDKTSLAKGKARVLGPLLILFYLYLITFLGVTSRKGDMIKNLEHDNPLRNVTLEKLCLLNIFPGILCQYAPEEEKNKTMVELCVASLPSCNKGRRLTGCDFCILFLQLSQLIQSTQSSSSEALLDTSEKSPLSGKKRNFLIHS